MNIRTVYVKVVNLVVVLKTLFVRQRETSTIPHKPIPNVTWDANVTLLSATVFRPNKSFQTGILLEQLQHPIKRRVQQGPPNKEAKETNLLEQR